MPVIEARITKVSREEGSEFADIHTDHDTIKKLGTKRPDLIAEAAGFKQSGAVISIEFVDRPKTLDDGRTFHNYYYSGGSPAVTGNGASATPEIPGVDVVPAGPGRPTDPNAAWRMALSTGGKLAIGTLPLMPTDQRDFETQWRIAVAWAERIFFTQRPERPSATGSPLNSDTTARGEYLDGPPPYSDSEIPF